MSAGTIVPAVRLAADVNLPNVVEFHPLGTMVPSYAQTVTTVGSARKNTLPKWRRFLINETFVRFSVTLSGNRPHRFKPLCWNCRVGESQ